MVVKRTAKRTVARTRSHRAAPAFWPIIGSSTLPSAKSSITATASTLPPVPQAATASSPYRAATWVRTAPVSGSTIIVSTAGVPMVPMSRHDASTWGTRSPCRVNMRSLRWMSPSAQVVEMIRPITVAVAAPRTPIAGKTQGPKMNSGSSTRLTIATVAMIKPGLRASPVARIALFITIGMPPTGKPQNQIRM